jgi:myo-inositol-1(or 4)-monophosphatase
MDYREICLRVVNIAREAGRYIQNERKQISSEDVLTKGIHDFVTYVDKTSEQMIIQKLEQLLPHSEFLAEESGQKTGNNDLLWIIDPLDGTTNFIHQLPLFTVSIALYENQKPVAGVIYEPNLDECFYAWHKGGAFLNEIPIRVSETANLNNSLLATGFPYYDYQHLDAFMEFLKFTIKETRGLRRLGSAALDMAWVACGRFEAFYEYGLRPWDVAAGICIIEEAGGKTSDFHNGPNYLYGKEIIASNGLVHNELFEKIQEYFFYKKN